MQVSIKSCYGLQAMAYLAKTERICSAREISQKEKIPFDFLEKIISNLKQEGLVKARRGSGGGYFLVHCPDEISLGKILKVLEDPIFSVSCQRKTKDYFRTKRNKCVLKDVWRKTEKILNATLNSITLADLIDEKI